MLEALLDGLGAWLLRALAALCLLALLAASALCVLAGLLAGLWRAAPQPAERASPLEAPRPGEATFWTDGDDFL